MVFSSLSFLFIFLPVILFLYYVSKEQYKNYILLSFSMIFYAYGGAKYLSIMIVSIALNYLLGLLIDKYRDNKNKARIILVITVLSNIGILGYYKYMNFFIENINKLLNLDIHMAKIVLPIGISFYTFQGLSYVIDVYRKNGKVQKNILNVALYISLFPQLIAGPIVRYETIAEQIDKRTVDIIKFELGLKRFILGLSKKVIISNVFGSIADKMFSYTTSDLNFSMAWVGILAYSLQIFYDFSGYSDMAIGLGKIFGFDFLENFNYPYISKNVSEFWRRWHISLGTWFRDYVYIPLGGNKVNFIRHILNILIVWFLTGFWHGSSWNFIVWGMYFGIILILEKFFYRKTIGKLPAVFKHGYALVLIAIGWVFFRSENLHYAIEYIKVMLSFDLSNIIQSGAFKYIYEYKIEWAIAIIGSTPLFKILYNKFKLKYKDNYKIEIIEYTWFIMLFIITLTYLIASSYNPFIYFRF